MSYGEFQLSYKFSQHRNNMPGMIQPEHPIASKTSSPGSLHSNQHSSLQSFSSLTLSPALSNGISPQHMMMTQSVTPSTSSTTSSSSTSSPSWVAELRSEERGLLIIQLLLKCAGAVAGNHMEYANLLLQQLSLLASITGDPMQRVATHFMEGLAARAIKSWPGVYKALNCTQLQTPSDMLSARQIFFNLCPYLKFAFTIVNHSILDAMEGEKVVHIIDLGASEAIQWVALLQMLSTRVGGPPHLRITIINQRKEVLDQLGQRLSEEAEALDIPFQFHPLVTKLEDLDVEMLRVKTGEAVAISSVLQLHYLLSQEERDVKSSTAAAGGSFPGNSQNSNISPRQQNSLHHQHHLGSSLSHHSMSACSPHGFIPASSSSSSLSPPSNGIHGTSPHHISTCTPLHGIPSNGIHGMSSPCSPHHIPSSTAMPSNNRNNSSLTETQIDTPFLNGMRGMLTSNHNPTSNPHPALHSPNPIPSSKADRALCMLRSLSPKIMVLMEQESNHNGSDFVERFVAALHYYGAMFDSLESSLPPKLCGERLAMEKHLFGREIHNMVACEGLERVERHEKLEQWRARFEWAGFVHVPLSYSSMIQAKRLLLSYSCDSYRLVEDRGCLTICWQDTPLFSASAWQA